MKKYFLIAVILMMGSSTAVAQDFQGEATYMSKTTMASPEWMNSPRMTPERRKRMEDMMKDALERTYILTFNKNEAMYIEEKALEAPTTGRGGGGGGRWMKMMVGGGGDYYKNMTAGTYVDEREILGTPFLVKDELPKYEWKMTGETKKIGDYLAFKATATKKVSEMNLMNMRRKKKDGGKKEGDKEPTAEDAKDMLDDFGKPKEIIVTAWYTPDVPINVGPADYQGLPGLILQVQADKTTLVCTKITMAKGKGKEITIPDDGDEMNDEDFTALKAKRLKEAAEMWGGGRGRGRGGRRG